MIADDPNDMRSFSILEDIDEAFFTLDNNWNIIYLNKECEKLLKEKRDKLLGKKVWNQLPESKKTSFRKEYKKAKNTGEIIEFEEYFESQECWFSVKACPSKNGLSVYFKDVTDYKNLLDIKNKNLAFLESIFGNAPVGIVFFNRDLEFVKINNFLTNLLNKPPDFYLGKSVYDLYGDKSYIVEDHIKKVLNTKKEVSNIEIKVKSGGDTKYFLCSFFPVFQGKDVRYIGIIALNITVRKEVERKLFKIFSSDMIGIVFSKFDGTINQANKAFANMLGYTIKEIKNVNWKEITPKEHMKINKWAIREVKKTGVCTPFEKEYYRKDGSRVSVLMGSSLLTNTPGVDTVTYVLDITDRKRLEKQKDEFLGIASHELKTPLTSIKAYTELLSREVENVENKKIKDYVHRNNIQISRLEKLINDLLDVSRLEADRVELNKSSFDMHEMIKDSVDSFQETVHSHKIKVINNDSYNFKGDKERLEQVFYNLMSNAVKYSPNSDEVLIKNIKKKDKVCIFVKDRGMGIPKEEQEKLFSRFYRAKHSAKKVSGVGIGLYISFEIVKKHGGTIKVKSQKDEGATFIVELPINN